MQLVKILSTYLVLCCEQREPVETLASALVTLRLILPHPIELHVSSVLVELAANLLPAPVGLLINNNTIAI